MPSPQNHDSPKFRIFRYSTYALAILCFLSYLGHLMYQLSKDENILSVKYHFLESINVPIMEMCSPGNFEILRCSGSSGANESSINGGCLKYLSEVNVTTDRNGDLEYCRIFKANETFEPNKLDKIKFFFKINETEAEDGKLGVALLTINFLPSDVNPMIEMDKAVQLRLQLGGNFIPAIVNMVSLIKFRTKIYNSILPQDSKAIFGLDTSYHSTPNLECMVSYFPFNKNPYNMPPEANGYFSVAPSDFIVEETTERRTTTVLSAFASAGGAFGVGAGALVFLFGSSRLNTWGITRSIVRMFNNSQVEGKKGDTEDNDKKDKNVEVDLNKFLVLNPKRRICC